MAKYGIKVDYYMYSDEKGMYTSPCFLYTDRSKFKLLVFDERIDRDDIDLRVFDSEKEAQEYMEKHGWSNPQCSFENPRIVKLELTEVV
jgi:hypothetical protein